MFLSTLPSSVLTHSFSFSCSCSFTVSFSVCFSFSSLLGFHILIVLSILLLTRKPEGSTAKPITPFLCPFHISTQSPLFKFQNRMELSLVNPPLTSNPEER